MVNNFPYIAVITVPLDNDTIEILKSYRSWCRSTIDDDNRYWQYDYKVNPNNKHGFMDITFSFARQEDCIQFRLTHD